MTKHYQHPGLQQVAKILKLQAKIDELEQQLRQTAAQLLKAAEQSSKKQPTSTSHTLVTSLAVLLSPVLAILLVSQFVEPLEAAIVIGLFFTPVILLIVLFVRFLLTKGRIERRDHLPQFTHKSGSGTYGS